MDELLNLIRKHFTPAELVDFLGVTHSKLFEFLEEDIEKNYIALAEEVCFEFHEDDD